MFALRAYGCRLGWSGRHELGVHLSPCEAPNIEVLNRLVPNRPVGDRRDQGGGRGWPTALTRGDRLTRWWAGTVFGAIG
jgi:hypothetical protein